MLNVGILDEYAVHDARNVVTDVFHWLRRLSLELRFQTFIRNFMILHGLAFLYVFPAIVLAVSPVAPP